MASKPTPTGPRVRAAPNSASKRGKMPGTLASLARNRFSNFDHAARCTHPGCNRIACTSVGVDVCRRHGGAKHLRSISARQARIRDARRAVKSAIAAGAVPVDLLRAPIWERVKPNRLIHHRPLLIAARNASDPAAWPAALAAAERDADAYVVPSRRPDFIARGAAQNAREAIRKQEKLRNAQAACDDCP